MIDIQNQSDSRNIEIEKVGVKNIRYPIVVLDRKKKTQNTIATINMYVNLPHHFKGTHMSRFIEILNKHRGRINLENLLTIIDEMKEKLNAKSAHLEVEFPYFVEKEAPVSKAKSLLEYTCRFCASHGEEKDMYIEVNVPITTVCPCSKEISEVGAHSQRGRATARLRFKKFIWIEDIIRCVEESASSEVYSLLKRSDEKFVTEKAYSNPMFVEDVVRNVAERVDADPNITWFSIEVENFESIHNHSAYAFVEKKI